MTILCLCRAPLNYRAGIPRFCKELYSCDFLSKPILASVAFSSPNQFQRVIGPYYTELVFPYLFKFGTIAISLSYISFFVKYIRSSKIIHLNHPDPFSSLLILFCSFLLGCNPKIIITWHAEIYKSYPIAAPLLVFFDFLLFNIADHIVYPTPFHEKSSFLRNLTLDKSKFSVIPLAIDNLPTSYQPRSIQCVLACDRDLRLLSVGRLVSYKGYRYAIMALRWLLDHNEFDFDLHYTIIGHGPLFSSLQSLVVSLDLVDVVTILSDVDDNDKFDFYKNSDLFLFPSISQSEAFGFSQLEAMSYSIPVLNTCLNNGVNYLCPSDVGFTVTPKSYLEISEGILSICQSQSTYSSYCHKSFERSTFFNIDTVRSNYHTLFND